MSINIFWIIGGLAVIDVIAILFTIIESVLKKTKEKIASETRAELIKKAVDREYGKLDGVLYIRDDGQSIGCWCDLYKEPASYTNGERVIFLIDKEDE